MMEDKFMTQEDFSAEVVRTLAEYRRHCEEQGLPEDRVGMFEKMIRSCANDFQLQVSQKRIGGTIFDWMCFHNGFIAGIEYGQQMTADSLGVGEEMREIRGT